MIRKMKKVILLTMEQFKKETLSSLAELGVVHLQTHNKTSLDLDLAQADKKQLEEAINALDTVKVSVTTVVEKAPLFGLDLARSILETQEKIKEAKERVRLLEQEKNELIAWGDIELEVWTALKEATGARLVQLTALAKAKLVERQDLALLLTKPFSKSNVWVPAIVIPDSKDFDWSELPLEYFDPPRGLKQIEECLAKEDESIEQALTQLKEYNKYKLELDRSLQEQSYRVLFESVLANGHLVEGVIYWEGFIPEQEVAAFKEAARLNGWAYALTKPSDEDNVPTQLKLNPFTSMLNPLYSLLGTFPGYKERDISLAFLLFFLVFVALLIGDAGYGIIYLLLGVGSWLSDKMRKKPVSDVTKLTFSLGFMITIWGTLSGTWFGSQLVQAIPPLKELVIPSLFGANPSSQHTIIFMVLALGFTQITFAHVWNFFWELKEGQGIRCIAQLGWLLIVSAVGWLVLSLVVDADKYPIGHWVPIVAGIGFIMVLLFGSQERDGSFVKGAINGLAGIMQTALGCISAFSDIVSYIRLFAVGLSGVAIADSFNGLGTGLFSQGILGVLGGVLIIVAGHIMCLALGLLSMIVHGVRLNLLEFSGHLGQQWDGHLYRPFGKKNLEE